MAHPQYPHEGLMYDTLVSSLKNLTLSMLETLIFLIFSITRHYSLSKPMEK